MAVVTITHIDRHGGDDGDIDDAAGDGAIIMMRVEEEAKEAEEEKEGEA